MKFNRIQLTAAAGLMLIVPGLAWLVLLGMGVVGSPGNHVVPPFNFSDRIITINVEKSDSGDLRARFHGWGDDRPGLTGEEFLTEIHRRKRDMPWVYGILDVTSITGLLWVIFGFAGQAVFAARMVVQWRASEKVRSSVVPPVFWWLSLLGASMMMIYFIWRKDIVGLMGQSTGWFIYIRNLWFIHGNRETDSTAPPRMSQ